MADASRGIEITKFFVFGTSTPDPNDYNSHIRPILSIPASITYDMGWYLNQGAGRYVYPSQFPAVKLFFETADIPDGTYSYNDLAPLLGFIPGESDLRTTLSQYGVDIGSEDHAERSYIFGTTPFGLKSSLIFDVQGSYRAILNMELIALQDGFDFIGGTGSGNALGAFLLQPTFDPYNLRRGQVTINFSGAGKIYPPYNFTNYYNDKLSEFDGFPLRELGVASLLANGGPQYFNAITTDPFLSYQRDGLRVQYGTPGNDNPIISQTTGFYLVGGSGDDYRASLKIDFSQ